MTGLNSLGWTIHDHLKAHRPTTFCELKASGQLNQHVLEVQRSVTEQLIALEHQGYYPHKAQEIVRDQIYPPSEEDVPNLGETMQPYTD